jgi:hypothetical protein
MLLKNAYTSSLRQNLNSYEVIPDDTGIEVSDLGTMQSVAQQAIEDMRGEVMELGESWQGWWLKVVCPAGHVLLSVPLEPTLN